MKINQTSNNNISDRQLVKQALENDQVALALLVKRHLKLAYRIAFYYAKNSDEAEDIAQETFVKVWKNLKKFNQEKSFTAWLSEIAKNTSLDWLKKRKAIPFSYFKKENGQNQLAETMADYSPTLDKLIDQAGAGRLLQSAIARLPFGYREVVIQHGQNELTFQEIADVTSQSVNTVKSRYRRGLALLKKHLSSWN